MPSFQRVQAAFAKFQRLLSENRTGQRQSADTQVAISWRDGRGRITHARARCLDISELGARIAYSERIVLPAILQIRQETGIWVRTGHVRRCVPKDGQFEIGVEFCNPAKIPAEAKQLAG